MHCSIDPLTFFFSVQIVQLILLRSWCRVITRILTKIRMVDVTHGRIKAWPKSAGGTSKVAYAFENLFCHRTIISSKFPPFVLLDRTAALRLFSKQILNKSEGMGVITTMEWPLVLSLLGAWVLVFICLCRGIKQSGKVSSSRDRFPLLRQIRVLRWWTDCSF